MLAARFPKASERGLAHHKLLTDKGSLATRGRIVVALVMSAPPPHKRSRPDADVACDEGSSATSQHTDDSHALLRSALAPTAARLAKHSAAAQSLITADEDAIDAAATCCRTLLREHRIELGVAIESVKVLASLAEGERTTWRELARLRDHPLAAALAGCDEHVTQQLHLMSELLQFPKHVSLVLLRQLAGFRIRSALAAGASGTAPLVRAEDVLAPLLTEAEAFVNQRMGGNRFMHWAGPLSEVPAFSRGFFADPEDLESLDCGRRELDHIAFGLGCLLSGRGLLPDLVRVPSAACAFASTYYLPAMAAAVGDVASIAAMHHSGHAIAQERCVEVAASTGELLVLRLAVSLSWTFNAGYCVMRACEAELPSDIRLQILSLLRGYDSACVRKALPWCAECGDLSCVRWLLEGESFGDINMAKAVERAAENGHTSILTALVDKGATLTTEAFQVSGDVATLQWFRERGHEPDAVFVKEAAGSGRLFQLEWAASVTDITASLTADVFEWAAIGGDILMMQWLHARGCPWDSRVLREARDRNECSCVVFALLHGCPVGDVALTSRLVQMPLGELKQAVQALRDGGRGELVENSELFKAAKRSHRVAVLEWLVCDLGVSITAEDCVGWRASHPLGILAVQSGCLRLLQHLCHAKLHKPSPADMRAVLSNNGSTHNGTHSLEVVRWLHAQGVATYGPLRQVALEPHHPAVHAPDFITFQAAREGALELLQVLVEECGAHWTESACVGAAEEGRMEVLRWAIDKHCSCAVDTWCAAVRCGGGKRNDYRPLTLLHSAKRPWSEAVWAAAAPYEEVKAWLKERGCPGSQAGAAAEGAGAAPA